MPVALKDIIRDDEFAAFIPALREEERAELECRIAADGFRDPLVVWKQTGILVDGYNRHDIWRQNYRDSENRPEVRELSFESRDEAKEWMLRNQLGRRNLSPFQRSELALLLEPAIAAKAKENLAWRKDGGDPCLNSGKGELVDTKRELARIAGVGHDTISKVKRIRERADDDTLTKLRRGELTVNKAFNQTRPKPVIIETEPPPEFDPCTVADLDELEPESFATIYADPPWQYGNQSTRAATDNHYETMSVEEICRMPVASLATENAQLHLWTTNGFLQEALNEVIPAWGFEYRSCFVWCKPQMGIGNYWRVSHEFLLLAVRGSATFQDRSLKSWAEVSRGRHSAKPESIRSMVERAGSGPRLELFARKQSPGWTVWGNEVSRQRLLEVPA